MESNPKQVSGEIFDIVNIMYLGLKGEQKRITKKASKLWNHENNLYKFMIALYNSSDINDKIRKPIEENINNGSCPADWETKKVSWKLHHGRINSLDESLEELSTELENIKEGKGYISEETHNEAMAEQLKEQQEIIRGISDQLGKARHQAKHFEDKCELQSKDLHAKIEYYKHELSNKIYQ
tara:strand:- start:126 stop:671 length:546 start_codon:yes stop_codon:yes gene_type:complete